MQFRSQGTFATPGRELPADSLQADLGIVESLLHQNTLESNLQALCLGKREAASGDTAARV